MTRSSDPYHMENKVGGSNLPSPTYGIRSNNTNTAPEPYLTAHADDYVNRETIYHFELELIPLTREVREERL